MIPQRVKASGAVAQASRFNGELRVGVLPRLSAAVVSAEGALRVDLQAARLHGVSQLRGSVSGRLSLQCLRCDRIFEWPLEMRLDLRLVENDDEERTLMQDSDPYWVQDDQLPLHDIVEDEALLALPMLPRCQTCETIVQKTPLPPPPDETRSSSRENPFAVLKGKLNKDQ